MQQPKSLCLEAFNDAIENFRQRRRKVSNDGESRDVVKSDAEECQDKPQILHSSSDDTYILPDLFDTVSIREYVLTIGLPYDDGGCVDNSLRVKVWKSILGVPCVFDATKYFNLLEVTPYSLMP